MTDQNAALPKCGCDEEAILWQQASSYWYRCAGCGIETPVFGAEELAAAAWTRAMSRPADAEVALLEEARAVSAWQPIATAPLEEGRPFLVAVEVHCNSTGATYWQIDKIWLDEDCLIHPDAYQGWNLEDYTHWMPLPEPPE